jgi:2'-5' RNA ligase
MGSLMTWLVPAAGSRRDHLADLIRRLADEYGTPAFQPHVTMVASFDEDADAAVGTLESLVSGVPPFEVAFSAVGQEPVYFRSLYLRAEPSTRLTAMHEAGRRAWALDLPPYMPHLSLLYSDLREEEKSPIPGRLGLRLPLTITVDAVELWGDFGQPADRWRRIARVPLGAGRPEGRAYGPG